MKILSFILSLGILILSCITCEDLPELKDYDSNTVSSITITKPCTETSQDHCSPLCICTCCGQPVISLFSKNFSQPEKPITAIKKDFQYNNTFISAYIQNIWQPPKLNNYIIG